MFIKSLSHPQSWHFFFFFSQPSQEKAEISKVSRKKKKKRKEKSNKSCCMKLCFMRLKGTVIKTKGKHSSEP